MDMSNPLSGADRAANEMPRKNMRPLTWRTIDPDKLHQIRLFHTENPLAGRCRTFVLDGLFSGDFTVIDSKGYALDFLPSYNSFFQRRFKEFSFDAYDAYMTLGFVPVLLVQHSTGHKYPVVPKYGTYIIQVAYALDTESMYYRVWRPRSLKIYMNDTDTTTTTSIEALFGGTWGRRKTTIASYDGESNESNSFMSSFGGGGGFGGGNWILDDSMSVITGLGYDPGSNGEIQSPLASIIKEVELTRTLEYYLKLAEHQMTHPPLMIQYHLTEDPDDFSEYNKEMGNVNYNSGSLLNDTEEMQVAQLTNKNLRKVHQFTKFVQASNIEQMTNGMRDEATPADKVAVVGSTTVIPKGTQHVKNDSNVTQAGDKYHAQKMLLDDQISGLYGIPLPLLRNVGALRGNIAGQNDIFRNTLIKHARMLGNICTVAFREAYVQADSSAFEAMFGCKPVVDDTEFVSYGVEQARKSGMETIENAVLSTVPPPSLSSVVVGGDIQMPESSENVMDGEEESEAIAKLKRENEALKKENKKLTEKQKKKKIQKTNKKSDAKKDQKLEGMVKEMNIDADAGEAVNVDYSVKLSVSHLMNDKMLQYAHQIGAFELHTLQNMMLNRLGFPSNMFKNETTAAAKMVEDALRDPSVEAPREDSTLPEGQGLDSYGKDKNKVISSGLLLELAQAGGDVDTMKAKRREKEIQVRNRGKEEAGTASQRKRSRDGVDRKGEVKGKPPAKKAKKK